MSEQPIELKLLHPLASMRKSSLSFWRTQTTNEIIASLQDGSEHGPLQVKPDGTVMQGNTRILILTERGVDVDSLPRLPYTGGEEV